MPSGVLRRPWCFFPANDRGQNPLCRFLSPPQLGGCVCGVRGPLCCGAPPQGLCNAPHDSGMCWKQQFIMCLEDTWFVAAFHSTPMHDPGLKEVQRPARVCVCKGASLLPCLLSCCCWRRRPPVVRRSRLRAAPPPDACPPESPWCRPVVAARRACQWRRGAWLRACATRRGPVPGVLTR